MDALDRELYCHQRLPVVTCDGPTARYMAYLAELDARVVPLPVVLPVDVEAVAG